MVYVQLQGGKGKLRPCLRKGFPESSQSAPTLIHTQLQQQQQNRPKKEEEEEENNNVFVAVRVNTLLSTICTCVNR